MQDTIFTKIINGELPSHKVYEDDATFAFLDIHPIVAGHTLVVPKKQVEFVWDLDDENYRLLMESVKKVAKRLREVMDVPYVGVQVIGVDVPHAHIQLVPFTRVEEYHSQADMSAEPNHEKLAEIASKLVF